MIAHPLVPLARRPPASCSLHGETFLDATWATDGELPVSQAIFYQALRGVDESVQWHHFQRGWSEKKEARGKDRRRSSRLQMHPNRCFRVEYNNLCVKKNNNSVRKKT